MKEKKMPAVNAAAQGARSPWVRAILSTLNRKSWTSAADLVKAAGRQVPPDQAIKVCEFRAPSYKDAPHNKKVQKGRQIQVMLACITLVQFGKVEQRGRGPTKEYRLA